MDYLTVLSENISKFRKEKNLTQDAVAEKLGISFQAVSKWENGQSCPDILLLPQLADIFEVSIDELFNRSIKQPEPEPQPQYTNVKYLPWGNDNTLHAVIFKGHTLLKEAMTLDHFTFELKGEPLNVECNCNMTCENVKGNVVAGDGVDCKDVGGDVKAGDSVTCAEIGNGAVAGDSIKCNGNIGGTVNAGDNVTCGGDINGEVRCGGRIDCANIQGNVISGGSIKFKTKF